MGQIKDKERGGGGAFSSSTEGATRKFDKPSNKPSTLKEDEWCHYGGLPSPKAYMD